MGIKKIVRNKGDGVVMVKKVVVIKMVKEVIVIGVVVLGQSCFRPILTDNFHPSTTTPPFLHPSTTTPPFLNPSTTTPPFFNYHLPIVSLSPTTPSPPTTPHPPLPTHYSPPTTPANTRPPMAALRLEKIFSLVMPVARKPKKRRTMEKTAIAKPKIKNITCMLWSLCVGGNVVWFRFFNFQHVQKIKLHLYNFNILSRTTPHTTPHHTTPHHTTPHHTTPHYTTPYHTTPHHSTPHHTTPHHTTPHHTTPHHTTPHHTTPHHTTPHHTKPHHTTSHHTTPHYITPHHTTPHRTMEAPFHRAS